MKQRLEKQSSYELGKEYEELAVKYLTQRGYVVLERNFRCRQGEIDLIAEEGGYLCFVEVKYRRSGTFGSALGAVIPEKQRKISRSALYYLVIHGYSENHPCRFDVLGISPNQITLIKNAFDYKG